MSLAEVEQETFEDSVAPPVQMVENLRPLGDRILFQRDPDEDTSKGGIHKPDVGQKKSLIGTVLAVGRSVEEVKVGDRIRFAVFSGFEIEDVGERWGMTRECEVWGVVDP